jgi:uncharacterized protein
MGPFRRADPTFRPPRCLPLWPSESKGKVDELAAKAIKAGAKEAYPTKDYGIMITRSFEDPDYHIWEVFWMDPAHVQME